MKRLKLTAWDHFCDLNLLLQLLSFSMGIIKVSFNMCSVNWGQISISKVTQTSKIGKYTCYIHNRYTQKSSEYLCCRASATGPLPLQLGLKCEWVLGVLAHIQNALGHADGAVVRLV